MVSSVPSSEQQPLLPMSGGDDSSYGPVKTLRDWRAKTAVFVDSQRLHKIVIALVAIDTVFVLVDLGYTFLSPHCHSSPGYESPAWLEVLSYISLAITSLFLVEIPVNLWAFGIYYFNPFGCATHAWLHLFDAVIIVTTFVLEIVLRGRERELASLLVVLRLWRLVKLVGGVAVGAGELEEENAKELEETKKQLEIVKEKLRDVRQENQGLRERLGLPQRQFEDVEDGLQGRLSSR